MENKSPLIALLMSFLIVGGGQFYNGQARKGCMYLLGAVLGIATMGILTFLLWIISMADAYNYAKSINGKLYNNPIENKFGVWAKQQKLSDTLISNRPNNDAVLPQSRLIEASNSDKNAQDEIIYSNDNSNHISFKDMNDKFSKLKTLYNDGILSFTEFSESKTNYISLLNKNNLSESKEDFLLGILPLLKNGTISEDDITEIKKRIF